MGAVCVCISCISLIAFYSIISFYCSIGVILSIGFFISLVSTILSITSLGNRVWFFIPFDYSAILPIVFYFLDVYQTDIYLLECVFMTFLVIAAILLLLEKFEM